MTAPAKAAKPRKDFGPIQLCRELELSQWQLERAMAMDLIARPDLPGGRWTRPVVQDAQARLPQILAQLGSLPDVGAWRAAEHLAERLGVEVEAEAVEELARMGALAVVGDYKGSPLYDGRQIEAFTDIDALHTAAERGRLLGTAAAVERLRCRRVDLDHLIRAGLLTETKRARGRFDNRRQRSVPLYRQGDLDDVAADPALPWDQIRAAAPGKPSPLAVLPTTGGQ